MSHLVNNTAPPILLSAIREHETLESSEIRTFLEKTGFLDMGTWTVVGDITRVYRGPNCEYKGWQRNTVTTPDAILMDSADGACSPEESRRIIIDHLTGLFPGERENFEKTV